MSEPVSVGTETQYRRALLRAFGERLPGDVPEPETFMLPPGEPSRRQLRAALRWKWPVLDTPALEKLVPVLRYKKRDRPYPSKQHFQALMARLREIQAQAVSKPLHGAGNAALKALGLEFLGKTGLRIEEYLSLTRVQVETAVEKGVLRFEGKGEKVRELPAEHVKPLLKTLLKPVWNVVFELYAEKEKSAHQAFDRFLKQTAASIGLKPSEWSPHMMRHGFASEMIRDGAPLPVVQRALGHSSYTTTVRNYVHVDTTDLEKWLNRS